MSERDDVIRDIDRELDRLGAAERDWDVLRKFYVNSSDEVLRGYADFLQGLESLELVGLRG